MAARTTAEPSVIVDNFVAAIAHVWGESETNATPLFERWASNVLHVLLQHRLGLPHAVELLGDRGARRRLTKDLADPIAARDWHVADSLPTKEFEAQIASTVNRFQRFVRSQYLRASFGQSGENAPTFDFHRAIDEGWIVLVRLTPEGGQASEKDLRLFGTMLLTDLWRTFQERGKPRDSRHIKPFYVYLDEFQKFLTPTIAENLDQARGYGMHLTFGHQFGKQLTGEGEGPTGRRVYDSVMENATTKVVFRLTDEENLLPLAKWLFRGVMDPDQVKHELHSTKVMEYVREEAEKQLSAIDSP